MSDKQRGPQVPNPNRDTKPGADQDHERERQEGHPDRAGNKTPPASKSDQGKS